MHAYNLPGVLRPDDMVSLFSSDRIILDEQVLLYQRFLSNTLVLGFLTTRK